jgi:septum formation protein
MDPFIYLASQSPRRQELLRQLGVGFELLLAQSDEDAESLERELPGEDPQLYVQRVCLLKAEAALARCQARALPAAPILTADTTVTLDGHILGKPLDRDHATRMLQQLAGRTHQVFTAVVVTDTRGAKHSALSISDVTFAPIDAAAIERYVASDEPFGKAGGYGIQGRAAGFTERIAGSYSGIMGLPLFETARLLRLSGVHCL